MEQLHLEPRTFHRYLNLVYEDDRRLLTENLNDTEILNQMAIARDRWMAQRHDLLEMARNAEIDDNARINAHHLAAEIAAAVLKLYTEGPAVLATRHKVSRSLVSAAPSSLTSSSASSLPSSQSSHNLQLYNEVMQRIEDEKKKEKQKEEDEGETEEVIEQDEGE
jgi:hypothetical protein